MPNNFTYSAPIVAREALAILTNNTVLAGLVYREYANEFTASKRGDTINIKKPAEFVVNDFTGSITAQDINEGSTSLQLTNHLDVTVKVTSKQWKLELEDFRDQVIRPAMIAFTDRLDKMVASTVSQFTNVVGEPAAATPMSLATLAAIDRQLNEQKVPMTGRVAVVNPATKEAMMSIEAVHRADQRGDAGTALREASMGRIMGVDFYMDQNIESTTDTPPVAHNMVFVRNAIALATVPLDIPEGAAKAAMETLDGMGIRVVYGYDINTKTDTISFDMLAGVKCIDPRLAARWVY